MYLIFLQTRIIGLHFATDSIGLASLKFFWWAPENFFYFFYFCKSDHLAVPGHPRSLILVPIESAYATSY